MTDRDLSAAQHEASHVVVGMSLGLHLDRVYLGEEEPGEIGACVWNTGVKDPTAWRLMYAAGVAWERRCGDVAKAEYDIAELRALGVQGNRQIATLERAAWALLAERHALHSRITRALLDRDLKASDIKALARRSYIR